MVIGIVLGFYYVNKSPTRTSGEEGENTNFFLDLFTFGRKSSNTNGNDSETNTDFSDDREVEGGIEMQQMKLLKISSMPIAGYTVHAKERFNYVPDVIVDFTQEIEGGEVAQKPEPPATEFVANLRYVARIDGHIYQTYLDKINERKISNNLIPKVEEAFFGDNGESVIMRYLKEPTPLNPNINQTIATYAGALPKDILGGDSASLGRLTGSFLPDNITDLSISPDSSNLFYLHNTRNGAIGTMATALGKNKIQIFDSGFTEWLSEWVNEDMITITTKPSYNVGGFVYKIDPTRKNFTKIFGNINGLTTLTSKNGQVVLYADNNLNLGLHNIESGEKRNLSVRTLPEKCVWSQNNVYVYCAVPKFIEGFTYPDIWYQGEISFSDDIWKINTENGIATKLIDPLLSENYNIGSQNIESIDGIKLQLDENEEYLFFVNKIDSYLWGLSLK